MNSEQLRGSNNFQFKNSTCTRQKSQRRAVIVFHQKTPENVGFQFSLGAVLLVIFLSVFVIRLVPLVDRYLPSPSMKGRVVFPTNQTQSISGSKQQTRQMNTRDTVLLGKTSVGLSGLLPVNPIAHRVCDNSPKLERTISLIVFALAPVNV